MCLELQAIAFNTQLEYRNTYNYDFNGYLWVYTYLWLHIHI